MTTAAMMAILRNLRARKPTIKPAINGKSITTNVGKPNMVPELMNSNIPSSTPMLGIPKSKSANCINPI